GFIINGVGGFKQYGKTTDWFWIVEEIKTCCKSYLRRLKKRDCEDINDKVAREFLKEKRNLFLEKQALEPNAELSKIFRQSYSQMQPDLEKAKVFYKELYSAYDSEYIEKFAQPCNNEVLLEVPKMLSVRNIRNYIKKLRKDIAPGPLGITSMFLKKFSKWVALILKEEFKYFLAGKKINNYWKLGRISLIPKKGDLNDMENWRPISVLNIEWKIFTGLINDTLYEEWETKMGPTQIGFRKKRWIHENHLILQAVLKNGW
ncbi:MAG TPA: reverse transcriptase domain-containing protein, partial [Saprospiraceae bacterium]|nr:reverse transcriptase domain-containing protein [Saprospiraceae bacterium]